jgi:NADPH-dependent 2,4-dienoyl-CoA reductase/sulfur reductase-like enzyme/CxxC motif-containing protein
MNGKNEVDVAVIGGGPAGLAAAIEAKKAGVDKVVIIERDERLGGLLHQCIHNGFGLQYFDRDLSGPEYAQRFMEYLKDLKIKVYLQTMVINITPAKEITAVSSEEGVLAIKAGSIVLAMGCRERSRGAINIPGSRPAGIFTAGCAQRYINVEGLFPGKRVVILGSGDIGMIMARRLTLENAEVQAVVEVLPYIGGLVRNECQCLRDFNIPVYLSHTVTKVHGNQRVTGVTISAIDQNGQPIAGTEQEIECDTLLLSVGLIPENELSKTAGIELSPIGGPVVDENMQTNIPGIFAAGNVVHVHDLVDYVTLGGERAGSSAARYVRGELAASQRKIRVLTGGNIRYIVPQYISEASNVTLYMRVTQPAEKVTLKIGDETENLIIKNLRKVKPSEMIKIDLDGARLSSYDKQEIKVNCTIEPTETVAEEPGEGREIICLTCPNACRGRVVLNNAGEITKIFNYLCKRGEEFAVKEIKNPERVLTATVRTNQSDQPLLAVRTDRPISKKLLKKCMRELGQIEIERPVEVGEIIVPNLLGSGANLVATLAIYF